MGKHRISTFYELKAQHSTCTGRCCHLRYHLDHCLLPAPKRVDGLCNH